MDYDMELRIRTSAARWTDQTAFLIWSLKKSGYLSLFREWSELKEPKVTGVSKDLP